MTHVQAVPGSQNRHTTASEPSTSIGALLVDLPRNPGVAGSGPDSAMSGPPAAARPDTPKATGSLVDHVYGGGMANSEYWREPPLAGTEVEHLVAALDRLRTTFR